LYWLNIYFIGFRQTTVTAALTIVKCKMGLNHFSLTIGNTFCNVAIIMFAVILSAAKNLINWKEISHSVRNDGKFGMTEEKKI